MISCFNNFLPILQNFGWKKQLISAPPPSTYLLARWRCRQRRRQGRRLLLCWCYYN